MKISSISVLENLSRLRASLSGKSIMKEYAGDEPPLRAELFSADQMVQYGGVLAGSHKLSLDHIPDHLLKRLDQVVYKL